MSIDYTVNTDYFTLDGVSSTTKNIWCDTPPVPPMAKQRYTSYQTGADEDRSTPDESFEDIKYKLTFYSIEDGYDNREIYSYIVNAQKLEISRLEGVYFKVRQVDLSSVETAYRGNRIKYTATFVLAPFKYAVSNDEAEIASGDIIVNNGSRYSKPTIELTGSGEITLSINGDDYAVTLPSDGETVIIDSDRYITYDKTSHAVLHNAVSGLYPMLAVGNNIFEITLGTGASVSSVKIKKNERWY